MKLFSTGQSYTFLLKSILINQGIVRIGERLIHGEFYYVMVNLAASIRPGYIPWETGPRSRKNLSLLQKQFYTSAELVHSILILSKIEHFFSC